MANSIDTDPILNEDPTAESRKKDHIDLAQKAQTNQVVVDARFDYEPLMGSMVTKHASTPFLGTDFHYPMWVSSMTGGTALAKTINRNLAQACKEFGLGMGLGSCRQLLYNDEYLEDFYVRDLIGSRPLYANLGIAQVERLWIENNWSSIDKLLEKLKADGLIVHINPMQEWMQAEGDVITRRPIDTIEALLEHASCPIIVKEVGQGMGPKSLRSLLELPLMALDFGAFGGTNFSKLELLRDSKTEPFHENMTRVGHTASEMVELVNAIKIELGEKLRCSQIIISGGIKSYLDGYYLINKCNLSAVYGQANGYLRHSMGNYSELHQYILEQTKGLDMAHAFLKIKDQTHGQA